jgi:tRNA(fMet)-specific endonuclease VapC
MYLLDTNVCIDFLTARSVALATRMDAAFGRLAISAVTFAELAVGSRRSENPLEDARRVDAFAASLDVLPFDESAGRVYGTAARALGVRRKSFDLLIGAHALSRDLTLVTSNIADFADIPGLRLENWTL